jgi:phage tail sheath protein FI
MEEVDRGPKPIEGVSTSTAGMVGVTERGPENVAVLVTSFPQFQRLYGGYLARADHPTTWYLPHGVEGFFQNGGRRLYLVRIAADNVKPAGLTLLDRGSPTGFTSRLIGAAREGDVFLVLAGAAGLTANATLRVGEGAATEYLTVGMLPPANVNRLQALRVPTYASYAKGDPVAVRNEATPFESPLVGQATPTSNQFEVDGTAAAATLAANQVLRIGPKDEPTGELVVVATAVAAPAAPPRTVVTVRSNPTRTHALGEPVVRADNFWTTLAADAIAGADEIQLTARPTAQPDLQAGQILRIGPPAAPGREYIAIASVPADPADTSITLRHRLAFDHPAGDDADRWTGTNVPNPTALSQDVSSGDGLMITDAAIAPGERVLRIGPVAGAAYHRVGQLAVRALREPIGGEHSAGEPAAALTLADQPNPNPPVLDADTQPGQTTLRLDTTGGLSQGDWIRIGGASPELTQIAGLPGPPAPANTLALGQPLRFAHAQNDPVMLQSVTREAATLAQRLRPGDRTVLLVGTIGAAANLVTVGASGTPGREFRELGVPIAPALVPLTPTPGTPVGTGHSPGSPVAARSALFSLWALDRGAWGNELRVKAEEENLPLVQTAVAASGGAGSDLRLESTSGIEPGTLLEFLDFSDRLAAPAATGDTVIRLASRAGLLVGQRLRIGGADTELATIQALPANPADPSVTLDIPLARDHGVGEPVERMQANGLPLMAKVRRRAGAGAVRLDPPGLAVTAGWTVRSREFKLTVEWVKRGAANPRAPGRERVVGAEVHRNLTLDDRHPRYVGTILGRVDGPLRVWDRRPEGQSDLVRVEDPLFAGGQAQTAVRPGPDLIYEALPGGRRRAVGRWLIGGDDDDAGVADDTYRGQDNVDPLLRTGLHCLRSREDVSIVAIPGRVSTLLQGELIVHCELMRYRMAVLDSLPGQPGTVTGAALPEVQAQRQQFDTRYAALYYPWLQLPDPFPADPTVPGEIAVPPSGHVLGIYARTDVRRGVHKAPANEVLGGILGLQRSLAKAEQDVLNPSPMNINVLRDFREQGRGLRVWGARIITSDTEWKYVPVRRLFIFVERSLEIGLQWVVFEPNDEPLWARVRRSIGDFLRTIWRNGGLQGASPEEAYFVKCDRSTMTQADIDNGRLIVEIGIAPVKPAEFVIIRIFQWQGGAATEEV